MYQIDSGKLKNQHETKDDKKENFIDNLNISIDQSGCYMAVINNDKCLRIRDIQSNSVVGKINNITNPTGMIYTMNNKHMITT